MMKSTFSFVLLLLSSLAWAQNINSPSNVTFNNLSTNANTRIGGPSPWIDITSPPYGAKCDGVTDDSAAINAAIAALPTNGGEIFIPPSQNGCLINNGVVVQGRSHVLIKGAASSEDGWVFTYPSGDNDNSGTNQIPGISRLLAGSGMSGKTMISIQSTGSYLAVGNGVEDLALECAGNAAIGLQILTTFSTREYWVSATECTVADFDYNTLNGTGQPIDTQFANGNHEVDVNQIYFQNYSKASAYNGIGMRFTGSSADAGSPNTGYSTFKRIHGWYFNSPGIVVANADGAEMLDVDLGYFNPVGGTPTPPSYAGGVPAGIVFDGGNPGGGSSCNGPGHQATNVCTQDWHLFGINPGNYPIVMQNGANSIHVFGLHQDNGIPFCVNSSGIYATMTCWANYLTLVDNQVFVAGKMAEEIAFTSPINSSKTLNAGSEMLDIMIQDFQTSSINLTSDTAANICSAANGVIAGNQANYSPAFDFWIRNLGSTGTTVTLLPNTGVTLDPGGASSVTPQGYGSWYKVMMTNCKSGSQAVRIVRMTAGPI